MPKIKTQRQEPEEDENPASKPLAPQWNPPHGSLVAYLCCCCTSEKDNGFTTEPESQENVQKKGSKRITFKESIPLKSIPSNEEESIKCPVKFVWDFGGKDVNVCILKDKIVQFVKMKRPKKGKHVEAIVSLQPGRYEFRFAVDGYWCHDPDLPALKNNFGYFNNMIKVPESGDIFEIKKPNTKNMASKGPPYANQKKLSDRETLLLSHAGNDVNYITSDETQDFQLPTTSEYCEMNRPTIIVSDGILITEISNTLKPEPSHEEEKQHNSTNSFVTSTKVTIEEAEISDNLNRESNPVAENEQSSTKSHGLSTKMTKEKPSFEDLKDKDKETNLDAKKFELSNGSDLRKPNQDYSKKQKIEDTETAVVQDVAIIAEFLKLDANQSDKDRSIEKKTSWEDSEPKVETETEKNQQITTESFQTCIGIENSSKFEGPGQMMTVETSIAAKEVVPQLESSNIESNSFLNEKVNLEREIRPKYEEMGQTPDVESRHEAQDLSTSKVKIEDISSVTKLESSPESKNCQSAKLIIEVPNTSDDNKIIGDNQDENKSVCPIATRSSDLGHFDISDELKVKDTKGGIEANESKIICTEKLKNGNHEFEMMDYLRTEVTTEGENASGIHSTTSEVDFIVITKGSKNYNDESNCPEKDLSKSSFSFKTENLGKRDKHRESGDNLNLKKTDGLEFIPETREPNDEIRNQAVDPIDLLPSLSDTSRLPKVEKTNLPKSEKSTKFLYEDQELVEEEVLLAKTVYFCGKDSEAATQTISEWNPEEDNGQGRTEILIKENPTFTSHHFNGSDSNSATSGPRDLSQRVTLDETEVMEIGKSKTKTSNQDEIKNDQSHNIDPTSKFETIKSLQIDSKICNEENENVSIKESIDNFTNPEENVNIRFIKSDHEDSTNGSSESSSKLKAKDEKPAENLDVLDMNLVSVLEHKALANVSKENEQGNHLLKITAPSDNYSSGEELETTEKSAVEHLDKESTDNKLEDKIFEVSEVDSNSFHCSEEIPRESKLIPESSESSLLKEDLTTSPKIVFQELKTGQFQGSKHSMDDEEKTILRMEEEANRDGKSSGESCVYISSSVDHQVSEVMVQNHLDQAGFNGDPELVYTEQEKRDIEERVGEQLILDESCGEKLIPENNTRVQIVPDKLISIELSSSKDAKTHDENEDRSKTENGGSCDETSQSRDLTDLNIENQNMDEDQPDETVRNISGGDVFKDVSRALNSIQKSRSRSEILVSQRLERSASKSRFLDDVKQKRKDLEDEVEKQKEGRRKQLDDQKVKDEHIFIDGKFDDSNEKTSTPGGLSESVTIKMDKVLTPMRDLGVYVPTDFDPNHREIKGMSEDVRLKKHSLDKKNKLKEKELLAGEKSSQKSKSDQEAIKQSEEPEMPKLEVINQKVDRIKSAVQESPTSQLDFSRHLESRTEVQKLKRPDNLSLLNSSQDYQIVGRNQISPAVGSTAPKVGINSFNTMGRMVLRAAIESGMDVVAVNDPFVPVNYMVYMMKFDMTHSHSPHRRKEMTIRESPSGQLIINGKPIHVFDEKNIEKIPWELAGANYVVEASDVLNKLSDAKLHLKSSQKGYRIRHIVEVEERKKIERELSPWMQNSEESTSGCCRVIIASSSPDAPLFSVGVNDSSLDSNYPVASHVSAPTAAITPVLHVLQREFGIRSCAYTLLKSIRGRSKEIKCQSLGPNTHTRSVKWDFEENLIPISSPVLEEETFRIMPGLKGKLHGMCVYVPTPEVSMFDLTVQLNNGGPNIYRDVCLKLKEASSSAPLQSVMRYCMKMSDENSASSVYVSDSHSSIIDGKSGCQVSEDTVKLVVWFDNEFGFASRIVDLISKAHLSNAQGNRIKIATISGRTPPSEIKEDRHLYQ